MKKEVLVVVLGELARSPRMQYHCISLAKHDFKVTVLAVIQRSIKRDLAHEEIETNQNIQVKFMPDAPDFKNYIPLSLLALPIKAIWQMLVLLYYLCLISPPHVILAQNPPSVPTLPVLWLYSKIVSSKLIIDWHNYGFTILSLSIKPTHPLVKLMTWLEVFFGRLADAGFTVTAAMKEDLEKNFKIAYPLHVLYDKPPKHFKPLRLKEKHNFFLQMKHTIAAFEAENDDDFDDDYSAFSQDNGIVLNKKQEIDPQETRFTMTDVIDKNVIFQKPNRPMIIFSSTSWTEDEDFDILLSALKIYEAKRSVSQTATSGNFGGDLCIPKLICIITGKGALKSYWQSEIDKHEFRHIEFVLPWLSCDDYPKMVACSDIGISLHKSSSGVDLPMKVVDMFGCGVPVLAYHYPTIKELLVEDFYGLTFVDSQDLVNKLLLLVKNFYVEDSCSRDFVEYSRLGRYKKNIKRHFLLSRWEDNWNRHAAHVFSDV